MVPVLKGGVDVDELDGGRGEGAEGGEVFAVDDAVQGAASQAVSVLSSVRVSNGGGERRDSRCGMRA
jgi:hypothetical protein